MKQKYTLHRNAAGGFTATFDDGKQYSGSLRDIKAMFDEPEPKPKTFSERMRAQSVSWIPMRDAIPVSNFTLHINGTTQPYGSITHTVGNTDE